MSYPTLIATRYIRSKKKRSISAISVIAIAGVATGVAALCVTISIATGFEDEFTRKVLGVNAHVLVMKYGLDFTEYEDVIETVRTIPEVRGVAPFVIQEMMISKGDHTAGVLLKGVDPKLLGTVLDLPQHLSEGGIEGLRLPGSGPPPPPKRLLRKRPLTEQVDEALAEPDGGTANSHATDAGPSDAGPTTLESEVSPPQQRATDADPTTLPGIVLGRTLAENLDAKVGDTLQVTTPLIGLDVLGWSPSDDTPRSLQFRVVGIFYAGFLEYDTKLVYVDLYQAQRFFDHGDSVTGVEVTVHDIETAAGVSRRIKRMLGGGPYHTVDWEMLNEPLFTALKTQKAVLTVVLAGIINTAALNIIATLVMLVLDKRREIAILKSMGAGHGGILRVFVLVGTIVGAAGIAIGLVIGFSVCLLLLKVGWPLDPNVYLIDHLPVTLSPLTFVVTAGVAFGICLLATIPPSMSASRLRPVDGLRRS